MSVIERFVAESPFDDPSRMGGVWDEDVGLDDDNAAKSDEAKEKHKRLMSWFEFERDAQSTNRQQMAIDEDFYDGIQWSEGDKQELIRRGQAPLVYNKIKPAINWLIGTEKRTRVDYKVLPRESDDEDLAQIKTKLLKYLSDVNRTPFARSKAWESACKVGIGWLEDGINLEPGAELIYSRTESWRNIYCDSHSIDDDLGDARYIFRVKWVDLDVALMMFPKKKVEIRAAQSNVDQLLDDWYLGARANSQTISDRDDYAVRHQSSASGGQDRRRVRLIECWYRVPESCEVCRGQLFNGQDFDEKNEDMVSAKESGILDVYEHMRMQVRVAFMTENDLLVDLSSPFKHNRFPFTPVWAYRRAKDNAPYGVIRDVRDAQEDYNKRASKALHILSTKTVITESGAVYDHETARDEVARPDPYIILKDGSKKFEINQDKQLAQEHLMLMDRGARMIQDISGITDENMGRQSNATSGRAILSRQEQGAVVTAGLFDNYRLAVQMQGEIQLSLMEQFYTEPKVIRIIGDKKPIEWVKINQLDPQTGEYLNDITARQADFVVAEQDFRDSIRQSASEQLMQMLSQVASVQPQAAISLLDMVVDLWDIPNKDEWLSRIRQINGQQDPIRKPTPEEQAQQQQAQQIQQMQQQAAMKKEELAMAELQAKIDKLTKDGVKLDADAVKSMVESMYIAMQAAQVVATVPGITPVADAILAGSGYKDRHGQNPNIPAPQVEPQVEPIQELIRGDGAMRGIQTVVNDGVKNG